VRRIRKATDHPSSFAKDPDGNEMRWYQVLTSDTQVTGRATTTMKKATTTMKKRKSGSKEKEETLPLS
jgi:hypothetical protein